MVNISQYTKDDRPHVSCQIFGRAYNALCDTGAKASVCDKSVLEDIIQHNGSGQLKHFKPTDLNVRSASGHSLSVLGVYEFHLELAGRQAPWFFIVVENLSSKVILGIDLLKAIGAKINCGNESIEWPQKDISYGQNTLHAKKSFKIHPMASLRVHVDVLGETRMNSGFGVACGEPTDMSEMPYVIEALSECRMGETTIVVINTTQEVMHVKEDNNLGSYPVFQLTLRWWTYPP